MQFIHVMMVELQQTTACKSINSFEASKYTVQNHAAAEEIDGTFYVLDNICPED